MAVPRFDVDLPRTVRGGSDVWDNRAAGTVLCADAFAAPQEEPVQIERWTGTVWAPVQLKRWTGTAWAPVQIERWTGTAWARA